MLKPVLAIRIIRFGFKQKFQTLVLTKDKVTHYLTLSACEIPVDIMRPRNVSLQGKKFDHKSVGV